MSNIIFQRNIRRLMDAVVRQLSAVGLPFSLGSSWTTDAPFRETSELIASRRGEPLALMKEALRVLKPNCMLAAIHWNYDPTTPRGPAMEIRPRPEQCIEWGRAAGFSFNERNHYDLPPYHYGLLFRKPFA